MLIAALFTLLGSQKSPALERYAKFASTHPCVEVDIQTSLTTKKLAGPKGKLLFDRNGSLLYKGTWKGEQYTLSSTAETYLELTEPERIYDEHPGGLGLRVYKSRISGIPSQGIPSLLFAKSIPQSGGKVETTQSGKNSIVKITQKSPMSLDVLTYTIDESGKLLEIDRLSQGAMGISEINWKLSNYRFPTKLTRASFKPSIPLGFSPFALEPMENQLQPGEAAPVTGWLNRKTKETVNLLKQSPTGSVLIAYISKDDGPAEACLASLKKLSSDIFVATIGENGEYADPTGKLIRQLNPAGTPSFFLVDKSGKIAKLWLGFDRTNPEKFEKEIRDAVQALTKGN